MATTRIWTPIKEYSEILFEYHEGIAKITINRPRYRNAFTPKTVMEMCDAMVICRESQDIYTVILTGAGDKAFCSGGDQNIKTIVIFFLKDVKRITVYCDVKKFIFSALLFMSPIAIY